MSCGRKCGCNFVDTRMLTFWEDFRENGNLGAVTKFVKEHEELELLFRGNSDNPCATVYRDNHVVLSIKKNSESYELSINFAHAKYCEEYESLEDALISQFKFSYISKNKNKIMALKKDIGKIDYKFIKDLYENILDKMFTTFFEYENYMTKYFDKKSESKKPEIEKIFQQHLFTHVLNGDSKSNNYLAFDLEFKQPYPCTGYRKTRSTNKPDMLAIRCDNGKYKLVLVEVKSTAVACEGGSGFDKHLEGMGKYLEERIFGELVIENRMKDAINIIQAYKTLCLRGSDEYSNEFIEGFVNNVKEVKDFSGIEVLFVFTDERIDSKYKYVPKEKTANGAIGWFEALKVADREYLKCNRKPKICGNLYYKKIMHEQTKQKIYDIENKVYLNGLKAKVKFVTYTQKDGLKEISI